MVDLAAESETTTGKIDVKLTGSWGISEWLTVTRYASLINSCYPSNM